MVVKCVIGVARLCDGRLSQRGKEVMVKLSESISRKKVPESNYLPTILIIEF